MNARYESHYFVGSSNTPFSKKQSDSAMELVAQATLFIENDYSWAYCEVWDKIKNSLISKLKRTYSD